MQPAISHYHSFFPGMLSFLMDTMISTWNLGWLVADSNHIFILSAEKYVGEWYRSVAAFTIVWRIGADSGVFSYTIVMLQDRRVGFQSPPRTPNIDGPRDHDRRFPVQHLDIRACPREHMLCKVPVEYSREELYHSSPTHFPKYDR